uniref:Calponin-homology (CH) domain-containing protein n=1 Tax=Ciona savignyi TaxID=51511 RepID=H2Y671_CIOSA
MSFDSQRLDEESLQALFSWIDGIPLSRKKKNLTRDFSDGLLVAEIVAHFFPKMVELHNYISANSVNQKLNNWGTLNRKVLSKLDFPVPADIMRRIAECTPGVVEVFLYGLWQKIDNQLVKLRKQGYTPERPYYNARTAEKAQGNQGAEGPDSDPQTEYMIKNPVPLAQLELTGLDNQTRLILEEKEQALLASQETVQILQVKIRRLEHLLKLKDMRLMDMEQRLTRFDSVSTVQSNPRH